MSLCAPLWSNALVTDFPTAEKMMEWIGTIVAQGIRRPAYPADRWVEEWSAQRLRDLGVTDVHLEPLQLPYWEPKRAELAVGDGAASAIIDDTCGEMLRSVAGSGAAWK